jgi:hypothetical protein
VRVKAGTHHFLSNVQNLANKSRGVRLHARPQQKQLAQVYGREHLVIGPRQQLF